MVVVLLALVAPAAAQDDGVPAAVVREWDVRRWAIAPVEHEVVLEGALADADWRVRVAALDAIARAAPEVTLGQLGRLRGDVEKALGDAHPNVRAAALEVLGREEGGWSVDEGRLDALAHDVLPAVRRRLAECLGRRSATGGVAVLGELAFDRDPRVAKSARFALLGLDSARAGVVQAQLALLVRLFELDEHVALMEALARLERGTPASELIDDVQAWIGDDERGVRHHLDQREARAWLAAFEALRFSVHGTGNPDLVVDGWFAPQGWLPHRRELLRGSARSHDPALGDALIAALARASDGAWLRGTDASERFDGLRRDLRSSRDRRTAAGYELFEAAVDCVGPMEALRLAGREELDGETAQLVLQEVGRRTRAWEPELGQRWLACESPAERLAAVEAVSTALVHRGDRAAGDLLAERLRADDGRPQHASATLAAFQALCDAADPTPWLDAMHAYWSGRPAAVRLELLADLPRGVRLAPFRDDLLALGASPRQRRQVVECLEAHGGDDAVRAALERWLLEDFARRESDDVERRQVELRVMALVRALWHVGREDAIEPIHAALVASFGFSAEVGKTAAAALGQSAAGRALLVACLEPEVDRRTRIEAAIALAMHGDERAVTWLTADFAHAAWDLRSRMLDALGRADRAEARAFLAAAALDGSLEPEQRAEAVSALVDGPPSEAVVEALDAAARRAPDVDTRRVALAALGEHGGPAATERLRRAWDELAGEEPGELAPANLLPIELDLLREECLGALGATGAFPEELEGELLRQPLEAAASELVGRFRSRAVSTVDFLRRGELELAASLARRGRLAGALAAAGPWWRVDARLLLALGSRAAEVERPDAHATARLLLRAALIAFAGEAGQDEHDVGRARLRLLSLAWAERDWRAVDAIAARLLDDWAWRRIPDSVWAEATGGEHEDAPVACAREQARAWLALERGDPPAARAHADAARELARGAPRLTDDQATLDAALDAHDD